MVIERLADIYTVVNKINHSTTNSATVLGGESQVHARKGGGGIYH